MDVTTGSYFAIWVLVGATLSMGCVVAAVWILVSSARKRESSEQQSFARRMEERVDQLSSALRETTDHREELALLTTALPGFTRRFMRLTHLEEMGDILLTALIRTLRCKKAAVYLQMKGQYELAGSAGLNFPDDLPSAIREGNGQAGWTIKAAMPMTQSAFHRLPSLDQAHVRESETLAEKFDAYLPLVFEDRVLGLICISGPAVRQAHLKGVLLAMTNVASLSMINLLRYEKILHLSETDPGTGLLNRRSFHGRFRQLLHCLTRDHLALLILDIDHFKKVNDTYGHLIGDDVLSHVGSLIQDCVQDGELACRYGGEEFVVVFRARPEEAFVRSRSICKQIQNTPFTTMSRGLLRVTVSGGLAFCPIESRQPNRLIQLADERLYQAKNTGRNRIFAGDVEAVSRPAIGRSISDTRIGLKA